MGHFLGNPSLLIALPQLQDPNFVKTVILLLEHNSEGAMGFVVNRPSPFMMKDVLQNSEFEVPPNVPTWYGGPVGTEEGIVLHNHPDEDASSEYGDIKISSSEFAMEGLLSSNGGSANGDLYSYRFIIGHAGWGKNQLDNEMKAGAWIQVDCCDDILFATPWQNMWSEAINRMGINPLDIAPTVQPYMN